MDTHLSKLPDTKRHLSHLMSWQISQAFSHVSTSLAYWQRCSYCFKRLSFAISNWQLLALLPRTSSIVWKLSFVTSFSHEMGDVLTKWMIVDSDDDDKDDSDGWYVVWQVCTCWCSWKWVARPVAVLDWTRSVVSSHYGQQMALPTTGCIVGGRGMCKRFSVRPSYTIIDRLI